MEAPKHPRQHFVPSVYLKAFSVTRPPRDWPFDRPFTPYVWVIDRSLVGEPVRKAPDKILWRRKIYTLDDEQGDESSIERHLSQLETEYAASIVKGARFLPLSGRDLITLYVFAGALHARIPGMMEHRQSQVDQIESIYRQVERGATGNEQAADMFFKESREAGRRLLLLSAGSYARVIGPHASLLVNRTPMPLITSDNPVTHTFLHVDELLANGFPADRLRPDALPNERAFLSITPLAPEVAMVSSPLLLAPTDSPYWQVTDIRAVVFLNEWTRQNADHQLISRYRHPYGPLREAAIILDAKTASAPEPAGLQIYTERDRYWIPSDGIEHGHGAHPLIGRLSFTTSNLETLHAAAADNELREITYSVGEHSGGLRNARFVVVANSADEASIIEMVL